MCPKLLLYFFIFLSSLWMPAQEQCLKNAHSHNDYQQKHPLADALKYKFSSIVSHLHPVLKKQNLEALYLKPLSTIMGISRK